MKYTLFAGLWLAVLVYLSACSVKFEVGYHGETAKDDKTYTSKGNSAKY